MNLSTIIAFQWGRAEAIRETSRSGGALWTGAALCLVTSIARNYDQTWILETPFWLFGNLLFSLVSSGLIFLLIYRLFIRRRIPKAIEPRSAWLQYRSFLGTFWMTAPIAWLYAIPVERWFDSYTAAQCNIALLAVVSFWRVLLLARVVSVTTGIDYPWTLLWTAFAASLEVLVVMFVSGFSDLGDSILRGMSGMRNSPEEDLLMGALGVVFWGALIVWFVSGMIALCRRNTQTARPFPKVVPSRVPWFGLVVMALAWSLIAIGPQRRLQNNFIHDRLVRAGDYEAAAGYLKSRQPGDFSHYKRFAPDPYASEVWEHLSGPLNLLAADDPKWVRQHYLYHMNAALSHMVHFSLQSFSLYDSIVQAALRLPEGAELVERRRTELKTLQSDMKLFKKYVVDETGDERLKAQWASFEEGLNALIGPANDEAR